MKKNNTVEEINTSINNLLEEWNIRLVNKMTQTRVSKAINVTFQQIQKYEKGLNICSPIKLLALSDYFNLTFDYWVKPIQNKNLTLITKRRENGYAFKQDFMAR
jgi:transcriptional regulator with XRE-family HTH domain